MSAPENEELKGANWHILFCHIELELWLALPDVRTFSRLSAFRPRPLELRTSSRKRLRG